MSQTLLIHGAWGGAWECEETHEGLRKLGHQARAIDLPGHGQFEADKAEVTMDAYVQTGIEAAEVIERLVYGAAMLPKNGDTPLGLMQGDNAGELLTKIEFTEDQSYATVAPEVVRIVLLNDIDDSNTSRALSLTLR